MIIPTFSLEGRVPELFDNAGLPVLADERTAPNWIWLTVNGTDKTISEVNGLVVWACRLSVDVWAIQPLGYGQFGIELDDRTSIHGKPASLWL